MIRPTEHPRALMVRPDSLWQGGATGALAFTRPAPPRRTDPSRTIRRVTVVTTVLSRMVFDPLAGIGNAVPPSRRAQPLGRSRHLGGSPLRKASTYVARFH